MIFIALLLLIILFSWVTYKRSYKGQKERFWREVAEGKEPDWTPVGVTPDGRSYTDPNCLIRTKMFKKDMRKLNKFFENNKNEKGEVVIYD